MMHSSRRGRKRDGCVYYFMPVLMYMHLYLSVLLPLVAQIGFVASVYGIS